jgi:hypothetical protein
MMMSEMWEQGLDPHQAEVHEPIVRDEDLWAHEMSDEPEQPEPKTRLKDILFEEAIIHTDGSWEVQGNLLDGTPAWILIHGMPFKVGS